MRIIIIIVLPHQASTVCQAPNGGLQTLSPTVRLIGKMGYLPKLSTVKHEKQLSCKDCKNTSVTLENPIRGKELVGSEHPPYGALRMPAVHDGSLNLPVNLKGRVITRCILWMGPGSKVQSFFACRRLAARILASTSSACVTLGRLPNLSVPWCPPLCIQDYNSPPLQGCCKGKIT